MKLLYLSLISVVLLAFSCEKSQVQEPNWINAVVEDTQDINCGLPRLDFSEDSIKVRRITGRSDLSYVSKGLPTELNLQGKRVKVIVENLKPEESFACLTLGINYPSIKILKATER